MRLVGAGFAALLVVAGCSSGPSHDEQDAGAGEASPGMSLKAHDGTNVAACKDGHCQVRVTAPVTIAFSGPSGKGSVRITKVHPSEIGFRLTLPSGAADSRLAVDCALTYGRKRSGSYCGSPEEAAGQQPGTTGFTLKVDAIRGRTAVIAMSRD